MYKIEEVKEQSLKYFDGDELAADVWINKYALRDLNGDLCELTPEDTHKRLSKELARVEAKYPNPLTEKEIFDMLDKFKYVIPAGSNLFGVGNNYYLSSLSNCFYIHHNNQDSYGGIMKLDEELVHLFKRRSGVGIDVSFLRPKNSIVNNAALSTTGAVSFMNRFSNTTEEVALNGRRAALMITMQIDHPEIEDFINVKTDLSKVTGANISIKVTDEFMQAVIDDKPFTLRYKYADGKLYEKQVNAKSVWDKFVIASHSSAEPGLLYWDQIKRESPSDGYKGYELEGVNPCSELTLSDSESCRLLSINLTAFVDNCFTPKAEFNFEKFKLTVRKAQRLMDDIVDLEIEKIEKILDKINKDPESIETKQREIDLWKRILVKAKDGRRTGLGITGLGDMLAMLNLTYGTKQSTEFSETVFKQMAIESYRESIILAKERGCFAGWSLDNDYKSNFIKRLLYNTIDPELFGEYQEHGRRNIANLTIAPNGSLSLLTQTTSGLEPVFMLSYKRRRRTSKDEVAMFTDSLGNGWIEYQVIHPQLKTWFNVNYPEVSINTLNQEDLYKYVSKSPYHKTTAPEIDFEEKIRMQGVINKWIDHSIN